MNRSPLLPVLGVALGGLLLSSCSATSAGSASCVAEPLVYRGASYSDQYPELKRDPTLTGRRVEATSREPDGGGCDPGPAQPVGVAEIDGVPLSLAFLTDDDELYVRDGRQLPTASEVWFRAPTCTSGGRFDLTADWLGVTSPRKARFDGDLRPPYVLDVHVTRGPEPYVGATITVRADAGTSPRLGPRDVRSSLWEGGQVVARVRCDDGRFTALSLRVPS